MSPTSLAGQAADIPSAVDPKLLRGMARPSHFRRISHKILHHLQNHVGVGIVCAVAYFDPGNWSVDLQAGATFGLRPMLFVILLSGIGAVIFQSMACRLGCVTGLDLAAHCRLLLYNRPKHRLLYRYGLLYPLYFLCEIAIISTDLAELLGSGIGLVLLFPSMPLWAAMLVTAADVIVFLLIGDPSRGGGRPARIFEWTVMILVGAVIVSFIILLVDVNPRWNRVFLGFVPSPELFQTSPNAVYTAVGIMGATVMPHALFLGSYLSTQDRVSSRPKPIPLPAVAMTRRARFLASVRSLFAATRSERIEAARRHRSQFIRPENNTYDFVHAHLGHGLVDIVTSLLCVAVPINSAILIVAATVFFHKATPELESSNASAVGLFDAHDLIQQRVGQAPAIMFAIALLCAGQTASITATLAGQIVSEGFIEWRISPVMRRIITRLLGLIPALAVAVALGRQGIEVLMVISQVILSIVLPFVVFPLIYLASSTSTMTVERLKAPLHAEAEASHRSAASLTSEKLDDKTEPLPPICTPLNDTNSSVTATRPRSTEIEEIYREGGRLEDSAISSMPVERVIPDCVDLEAREAETDLVDFSVGRSITILGYLFWGAVIAANVYALIELALGNVAS